jgi:hypothetical protein
LNNRSRETHFVLLSFGAMMRQEQKLSATINPAANWIILEDDSKRRAATPRYQGCTGRKMGVRQHAELVICILGCSNEKGAATNSADKNRKTSV